ncbi:MAG: SAM-dependent methyltransferase [Deltaproteobacteria bacterium]|nr:SAM-dependent methyltransferase [Deltaproteobacteria bacterium]
MSDGRRGLGAGAFRGPGSAVSGPVREILRRIIEKGPLTFAEFMEVALYREVEGYYTSSQGRWGGGGDYITSLDVSPVFSSTLAKEVVEMWEVMDRPADFTLVEAGAGRGWLSKGILDTVREIRPGLFKVIKARLVEKNPHLRQPPAENITWHEDLREVPGPFQGVILTNELIDSFPVHRVVWRNGLKEIYTGYDGGSFIDVVGPVSTVRLTEYFRDLGVELAEGQKAEVNLASVDWIKAAGDLLEKGFVVTIDYGLPARELYAPERDGTLLCHYRHTLNDDPYINIGAQDITTHVDFTAFAASGRSAGLQVTGFTTQKNFLLGLGILEELKEPASFELEEYEKIKFNRELSRLITPGGMGDTFKVLVQHKSINKPSLRGFSFKDLSGRL